MFPEKAFELAKELAKMYKKNICFLGLSDKKNSNPIPFHTAFSEWINLKKNETDFISDQYVMDKNDDYTELMEHAEASMVIFEIANEKFYNKPIKHLEICRGLRIPYFFVKTNHKISFNKVLVPIGFLNEEREKGPFSSSLGRFFNSEILLMTAKDYGSRAKQNTDAIKTLLDKFKLKYSQIDANKDSFKVELEATKRSEEFNADIIIISASRDYGMDDILFGPKELKVIKKALVPIMVINPRKDLYTLCH